MKATVLSDNISGAGMCGEWGLCIHIENNGVSYLLDTGASGLFLHNASILGINISSVDYAVLSHAHDDHAGGMADFFRENRRASFYLRRGADENCYQRKWFFSLYIGIPKRTLKKFGDRIVYVDDNFGLGENAWLIPDNTDGLESVGITNHMYLRRGGKWTPDDFSHEQSLVFDTPDGLVIFNSCCHAGADRIIRDVAKALPSRKIRAVIGGFHIHNKTEDEVRDFAHRLRDTGVEEIFTGHCTGDASYRILKSELGECVHQMNVGSVIEF